MPLPESHNAEWPPYWWTENQKLIEEARSWLVGDVAQLAKFYSASDDVQTWRRRVANVLAGKPDPGTNRGTDRLHVPLPKQIARTSASLLFSDGFSLLYPEAHEQLEAGQQPTPEMAAAQLLEDTLAALIEDDRWVSKLWQAAYVASGEGGVYLLPAWYDGDTRPTLRIVHHNRGIPIFVGGRLVEVTLWSIVETTKSGDIYRHLEVHSPGRVQHALYRGKAGRLGQRLGLDSHRATAKIRADRDGFIDLRQFGIEDVLPEYVPNLLPHPVTLDGDIGGADTQGHEDQLYALDSADSGWEADVRVGKRRIIVDESMLERQGRGGGAAFDTDREVFTAISHSPIEGGDPIKPIDFSIRAADFSTTVESRFARCCTASGYNPESVTWSNSGQPMTATEVLSRDALSRDTTNAKRRFFAPAIVNTARKYLAIYKAVFGGNVEARTPELQWPQVDDGKQSETADLINTLSLAGAISTYRKVQLANPTWTDAQIQQEVNRIYIDQGMVVEEPDPREIDDQGEDLDL